MLDWWKRLHKADAGRFTGIEAELNVETLALGRDIALSRDVSHQFPHDRNLLGLNPPC